MTATLTFVEITPPMTMTRGWHADPQGQHQLRYNDGKAWTEHVTHSEPTPCLGCGANV